MNRSWDKGHFRLKPKMSWQRTVAKISSHWDQGRYSKGWGGGGAQPGPRALPLQARRRAPRAGGSLQPSPGPDGRVCAKLRRP